MSPTPQLRRSDAVGRINAGPIGAEFFVTGFNDQNKNEECREIGLGQWGGLIIENHHGKGQPQDVLHINGGNFLIADVPDCRLNQFMNPVKMWDVFVIPVGVSNGIVAFVRQGKFRKAQTLGAELAYKLSACPVHSNRYVIFLKMDLFFKKRLYILPITFFNRNIAEDTGTFICFNKPSGTLMQKSDIDLLIVGAGPVGCVVAEIAARELGWVCLIIDKRPHLAGNCFDSPHSTGVLIHNYGPHYFRTNSDSLLQYLSRFTEWIPGNYRVKSFYKDQYYSFPINLTTLEQFFGKTFTPTSAKRFLNKIAAPIEQPKNSEEFVLSRVGKELYEAFYLGYTQKQWARHPRELDPSVCGRIPIRFNRDDRYVDHRHQVTPAKGFTALFKKMIDHPKIRVQLNTDFQKVRGSIIPRRATIYCGPLDEYFDFRLGRLPWRSLRFDWKEYAKEFVQPCVQINYPNNFDYTRAVEIKHVTAQKLPKTVVSYEYPQDQGDPYYPVPSPESQALFQKYQKLAERETALNNVYFAGRLAQYRYINTDEAIEVGIATADRLKRETLEYV